MLLVNGKYILRSVIITAFAIKVTVLDDGRGPGYPSDYKIKIYSVLLLNPKKV